MAPLEKFQYVALSNPKTELRLLRILEADEGGTDGLNCELTTWPIKSSPTFHAISYTWGNTKITKPIVINGKQAFVGENCHYALKQAHSSGLNPGGDYYLWIDSICINQEDIKEKNEQVKGISAIYEHADIVLACVGEAADESHFFCEYLLKHAVKLTYYSDKWRTKQSVDSLFGQLMANRELGINSPDRGKLFSAFQAFVNRPYFTRVWILQELFMAKNISMCCGDDVVPLQALDGFRVIICQAAARGMFPGWWADFRSALQAINPWKENNASSRLTNILNYNFAQHHMDLATRPNTKLLPLGEAAEITFGLDCQDPRDKVYALSALIDWGKVEPIQADYSIELFALAIDVFLKIAQLEIIGGSPEFYDPRMELIPALGLTTQTAEVAERLRQRRSPNPDISRPAWYTSDRVSYLKKHSAFWLAWKIIYDDEHGWRLECNRPISLDPAFDESKRQKGLIQVHMRVKNVRVSVCLPPSVQHGDYLLAQGRFTASIGSENWLGVVARPNSDSPRCDVVGKAIIEGNLGSDTITIRFGTLQGGVMFDPEDLVIFTAAEQQYPSWEGVGEAARAEFLSTRVCRAPGSSFAIVDSLLEYISLLKKEKELLSEGWNRGADSDQKDGTAPTGDR
ncbi:heterokaryon incompatibility [Colletotrichum truncatum]|uniref:Heterokaryon incompatibility n=1 Tax=Colletotrichum truncatum TaxID=5467 RepID=A0ACC3YUZ2_COLTU|nr:heterokaryon incompatibility [Colletotrichum truncatum]KAF6785838.1 heterokaryon incompatibility [Colletotrichum truncatum]